MATSQPASLPPDGDATLTATTSPLPSLEHSLQEIDGLRRAARERGWRLLAALGIAWLMGILAVAVSGIASVGMMLVVGAFGSLSVYFIGIHGPAEAYKQAFKSQVIGRLVAARYEDASFSAGGGIGQAEFESSRLYQQGIDRYNTEDLIEARLGATGFRMAEIHAEYKTTTTDSKGRTTTHWHTIFKGRFLVARFSKRFQGTTLVLSEAWRLFGMSGLEKVTLEDPAFEKLFAVYATDQVEARYLLSPSLMERLVASRQKLDAKVQAAFMDDHVILAIPDSHNRFEPPSFWSSSPLLSEDDVQTYAADIALAAELIGELNLERRIWERG